MQAAKQAAPEQSDEADEETFCGVCEQLYAELTEENENWIQCDICPTWYHFECVGIHTTSLPENYVFVRIVRIGNIVLQHTHTPHTFSCMFILICNTTCAREGKIVSSKSLVHLHLWGKRAQ